MSTAVPAAAARIAREMEAAFNVRDISRMEAVLGRHVLQHGNLLGRTDIRQRVTFILDVLPDARLHVEDFLVAGDQVAWSWAIEGTHLGEYMRIPASGRTVRLTGLSVARLKYGLVAEYWEFADEDRFRVQLEDAGVA